MARMYPARPRVETKSQAELKLYHAFREALPDDYVVFHSVAWLARDPRSGAQDGEADFVVAHPARGVLVVEVKGGRITYDGAAGRWYSNEHSIQDPFEQARGNKHSLLAKLKDLPYWRSRWLTIGHAVAFPDVVVKHDLRLDAPQEIILDARDLMALRAWVDAAFTYYAVRDAQAGGPGQGGVEELVRLLSPSWELRSLLGVEFADEEEAIIRLTEEQFSLLDLLSDHRRVAISGCAGSGKTTMAVEQARRLGGQGFRVLLTCFNRHLAEFLRSDETLPRSVEVAHFHGACVRLAGLAGLSTQAPANPDARQPWYDQTLPNLLLEAADRLGAQYDAIIVDEGQDFLPEWWLPLMCLLADPDHGILYIFHDDNQNIYGGRTNLPSDMEHYTLRRNLRNTQSIHRTFLPFYHSSTIPTARGPEGRQPEVTYYASEQALREALRKTLHGLVFEEDVPTEDIVVLTPRSRNTSALWRWPNLGNLRLTDRWPPGPNEVYYTSVYLFKGLESPVVILAELSPRDGNLEALLYVGCSRARNHLIMLAEDGLMTKIPAQSSFLRSA